MSDDTDYEKGQSLPWSKEDIAFLLSHSADVIWRLDANLCFTYINSPEDKLLGYKREELIGAHLSSILSRDSMRRVGEINSQRVESEKSGTATGTLWVEVEEVTKDGSIVWAEITSTPIRDDQGSVIGFTGITRDISGRKKAEERLRAERLKLAAALEEQAGINRRMTALNNELEKSRADLFASQTRYRLLVDTCPFGIAVHQGGRFVILNKPALEIFRVSSEEELKGTRILDRVPEENRQYALAELRKFKGLNSSVPPTNETFLRMDGSPFTARVSGAPFELNGEKAFLTVFEDITKYLENAKELAQKTEELDSYFKLAPDLLCIVDNSGSLLRVNPAWERVLGYREEGLLGAKFLNYVHPDDTERTTKAFSDLMEGREIPSLTNRYRASDSTYKWIEWRSSTGQGGRVYAAARDVTDRVEMEDALKASETRLSNIISASPMGMHTYKLMEDGRLIFTGANRAADSILGVDNSQFIGMTIEEAFPPLANTDIPSRYREACENGTLWDTEQMVYQDGKINGAYQVFAFQTARGEAAVMFLDITEKKKAAELREQLETQLRQSQKMEAVGRLAGGVAHDFNNLLTAIIGYCDIAHMRSTLETAVGSDIDHIRLAAQKAADLTQQLLAFSRKQILQPKVVNLADAVSETRKMLSRLLTENISLRFHLPEDTGLIKVDPGQISQVIINLAINARDAMENGGVLTMETGNVLLDEEYAAHHPDVKAGEYVMLAVSDTGVGMSKDTLGMIFEPFFTTKDIGKGTGLGLSTVHGIVSQSGGLLTVYSEEGIGTTFKIYFPRVSADEIVRVDSPAAAKVTGRESILIAEDSEDVREMTKKILSDHGYQVTACANGDEALARAKSATKAYDLLITDVVMPAMSGKELAERIGGIHPQTRVLFMSGYTENAIVHHGVLEEGLNFLQKPFRTRDLTLAVRKILDK